MSDKIEKYLSVGIDVGADFSEMSIALPSFEMYGNPFKIIHRSTELNSDNFITYCNFEKNAYFTWIAST